MDINDTIGCVTKKYWRYTERVSFNFTQEMVGYVYTSTVLTLAYTEKKLQMSENYLEKIIKIGPILEFHESPHT